MVILSVCFSVIGGRGEEGGDPTGFFSVIDGRVVILPVFFFCDWWERRGEW